MCVVSYSDVCMCFMCVCLRFMCVVSCCNSLSTGTIVGVCGPNCVCMSTLMCNSNAVTACLFKPLLGWMGLNVCVHVCTSALMYLYVCTHVCISTLVCNSMPALIL